ncbi:LPS export ABC transporter permease LptG [Viridibacterium curvum]|uniref:LPS export ABC transporter permease LptG n=1 Tax=Viridibacterium curvum TaxID=1101404 RepID=A0ABP9QKR1_9RHOO
MKTLNRYLFREVLAASALVLVAFLALFLFFDFLAEMERVGQGGYRLKHAIIFVLLTIPSRAYEILPIASLVGGLYALTQLSRHSELTVMRAAGVSTTRLLGSLMRVGVLIAVTTFVLGEYVAPPMERAAQKWRLRSTNASVPQELRTGVWLRDGRLFVNVRRTLPDGALEGVRIYEFDEQHKLIRASNAARGEYSHDAGWVLSEVQQTRFISERKIEAELLPRMAWQSELTPEMLSAGLQAPERMALSNLYGYVRHLEENQQRTGRYEVAFWKKVIYPFTALVMLGLALPFCLGNQRSSNVSARILLGVMLGMGFYLLNGLSSNLGIINDWRPLPTAAAPSLTFLLAALFMLRWVERR